MSKKIFLFFIGITLGISLIGCGESKKVETPGTGKIDSGELYNLIKSVYEDAIVSYSQDKETSTNILDIRVNVKNSSPSEELQSFNKICDDISKTLNNVTYYSGIIFTMQVDNEDKACLRSYSSVNGEFKLVENYIEDEEYKR